MANLSCLLATSFSFPSERFFSVHAIAALAYSLVVMNITGVSAERPARSWLEIYNQ